jgi:hypothetical protein
VNPVTGRCGACSCSAVVRAVLTLTPCRASAVSDDRLRLLSESAMPFEVASNTSSGCQWQVNSRSASAASPAASAAAWVIEVLNNNGVTKAVNASEVVDATFTMLVNITAKFA